MTKHQFFTDIFRIQNAELLHTLEKASTVADLNKGDILIRIGDRPQSLYFLMEGIYRGYYYGEDGKELTDCFGYRCGDQILYSYSLEGESRLEIQILEKSTVLCIPVDLMQDLMSSYPQMMRLYNQYLSKSLKMHWETQIALKKYDGKQRYKWFRKTYAGAEKTIKQKYIASFLNITPPALSRLRRELRQDR